ncbi:MAG: DUF2125 domain-containing protein [Alphaproteobacteria bacterium]
MIQRKYLIPIGVVALLVAVWTLGWFWFAGEIRTGLQTFADQQSDGPVAVSWESVEITGYPTRLFTHIAAPRGAWSGPDGEIRWAGPATTLKFFTDFGRTVSFSAPGVHSFLFDGGAGPAARRAIEADNIGLSGRMNFNNEGYLTGLRGLATGLDIEIDRQPVSTLDSAAVDWILSTGAENPEAIHPAPGGQELTFALSGVSLAAARLDPNLVDVLGHKLDQLAGQLSVRGALDPTDLSPGGMARWRDAGGTLELEDFSLVWGPLQVVGDGTLAVDANLQPVGAFTAQIAGLDRLVDLLETTGRMRPQQAAIARIALAVLTRAPANGGSPQARVPVSIQDRQLSIGPITLLRLPVISWN